ncbi:TerB family tellurite resistance protein [Flavobacteriaceae bacterium KMM 6897]|nr:TerB family tellurite resistance protein [Flavobacteriaceae bacterium KMM 6897]MEB8345115.1 TerB family tellurite resistance protein [Flavobacteriaceae bacterium KMM 6898]
MEFNLAEKLAIVKAIDEVILADGYVSQSELVFLGQLTKILKFESGLIEEARKTTGNEGLSIINAMSEHKKTTLIVLLQEMAKADGKVDDREIDLIQSIISHIGVYRD